MIRDTNEKLLDGKTRIDSELSYRQSIADRGNVLYSIKEQTGSIKELDGKTMKKLNGFLRMKVPSVKAELNSWEQLKESETN